MGVVSRRGVCLVGVVVRRYSRSRLNGTRIIGISG